MELLFFSFWFAEIRTLPNIEFIQLLVHQLGCFWVVFPKKQLHVQRIHYVPHSSGMQSAHFPGKPRFHSYKSNNSAPVRQPAPIWKAGAKLSKYAWLCDHVHLYGKWRACPSLVEGCLSLRSIWKTYAILHSLWSWCTTSGNKILSLVVCS